MVIDSNSEFVKDELISSFSSDLIRFYYGTDLVGNEIGAMGGKEHSAYGLCHLGDYEATLFSKHSQNRCYGEAIVIGNCQFVRLFIKFCITINSQDSFWSICLAVI